MPVSNIRVLEESCAQAESLDNFTDYFNVQT